MVCVLGFALQMLISFVVASPDYHNQDQLSFEDRIDFCREQFAHMPKSDDFKIEIIALLLKGYSYQEYLDIIGITKKLAQEKNDHVRMEYFHEAFLLHYYKGEQHFVSDRSYQFKLDIARHEAGHAVVTIMNEDLITALYYVTMQERAYTGGHYTTINLSLGKALNVSDDDIKMSCKNAIKGFLGGGIAEQLYNIPARQRVLNIDHIDTNDKAYNFLDFISRKSVGSDLKAALELANFIALSNHNFAEGYKPTQEDEVKIVFAIYQETRDDLLRHKDKIDALALQLIEKETIFIDEAYAICGKPRPKFYFEQ